MAVPAAYQGSGATRSRASYLQRSPSPSGLADVLELILDKGLVIDVYVRVSLIGIEILTIDARIVIASVDTYLRFAEAVNRLDLTAGENQKSDLTEIVGGGGLFGDDEDEEDEEQQQIERSRSGRGSRSGSSKSVGVGEGD